MLINNSELISDVVKMQGLVSQKTLDEYNPMVIDHTIEQKRRETEKEQQAKSENQFNFPEPEPVEEEEQIEE